MVGGTFGHEFSGAFYYVMARGNQGEMIFHDDDDRGFFLAALSEACAMTGWRVHAFPSPKNPQP